MAIQRVKSNNGFTLLEMMVAIILLSLLSLIILQIMHSALGSEIWGQQRSAEFVPLQRTMIMLDRDFTQILAKQSADTGQVLTLAENSLSLFSQDGASAWVISGRSELITVRWSLHDHILWRQSSAPNAVGLEGSQEVPILHDVDAIQWRVYQEGWTEQWLKSNALPSGISLTLYLRDGKIVQRIFLLTGKDQKQSAGADNVTKPGVVQ